MFYFIILFSLLFPQYLSASNPWAIVNVPVADVRAASGTIAVSTAYDPNQETQLLYGEVVKVVARAGDWIKIEALEQEEYSHINAWQGYPGWILGIQVSSVTRILPANCVVIRSSAVLYAGPEHSTPLFVLSLGTRLNGLKNARNGFREIAAVNGTSAWIRESDIRALNPLAPERTKRDVIVETASLFLGTPYFWGGRSASIEHTEKQVTGVDCSGLVSLAYRAAGIDIPRDALEQAMRAKKIRKERLKKGDLIFSATADNPKKITHVAIYLDAQTLLEAPQTGLPVRRIEFEKKFGVPLSRYREGEPAGGRILSFGTFFTTSGVFSPQ